MASPDTTLVGVSASPDLNNMGSLKKLELARNNFYGSIPVTIGRMGNLVSLLLDKNEFSGHIPLIVQGSLKTINLSYNKLQGKIPESMARFGGESFVGNPDLCVYFIPNHCETLNTNATSVGTTDPNSSSSAAKWMILTIVVTVLLLTVFSKKAKTRQNNLSVHGEENSDEAVKLHIPNSSRKSTSSSRKGGNHNGSLSSKKISINENQANDLVMVNEEKVIFCMPDLMKAAAEVIGTGGLGSAYKAVFKSGLQVVVKRYRDMNKLNKDAFDTEVRRLGRIRHINILPLLVYHYRKDEKLLVSEFVPKGSLMFLLHGNRGVSHTKLTWPIRLKIIKGVARGLGLLHNFTNYELPHGNLKSSNILLSSNYNPLLTDYGLYSLISNTYSASQSLFIYKSPEAVLYQQLSPNCDVYCLGIVILEIMTGKFPSQYYNNQKGGTDLVQWVMEVISSEDGKLTDLIDPEIANVPSSLSQIKKMLKIGVDCSESNYEKRIEMREVVRCIKEVTDTEVYD